MFWGVQWNSRQITILHATPKLLTFQFPKNKKSCQFHFKQIWSPKFLPLGMVKKDQKGPSLPRPSRFSRISFRFDPWRTRWNVGTGGNHHWKIHRGYVSYMCVLHTFLKKVIWMYKKLSSVFFREILYLSVRFNLFLQYKPIYMSYTVYIYIYIQIWFLYCRSL